jgi:leucyl aminopeptidase
MKITVSSRKEHQITCDLLVLPVFKDKPVPYSKMDRQLGSMIRQVVGSDEFKGEHLDQCLIHTFGMIKPERILLTGLGERAKFNNERMRQSGGKVASTAISSGFKTISLSTVSLAQYNLSPAHFAEGMILGSYRFNRYRKDMERSRIVKLYIIAGRERGLLKSLKSVRIVSEAVRFARDLVNTPSNELTPTHLARVARGLGKGKLSVRVLDSRAAEKEGMGAFLSVSRGSKEKPRFIVIEYKGGRRGPIVLIGKSVTFDSGGLSLKPSEGMEKMKYDMSGGAAVLGAIKSVSELSLPVHIVGILPATENLPGGSATKPGDVVRTVTGRTIEIVNTDAEGRLTLADAIGYGMRYKPEIIIDIATLTGACSIALGNEAIAMMGNDDKTISIMKRASEISGEKIWQMPLFEEYREYLKSELADIKNTGGRAGALVTAGYFLKEFAGETPWIHLDIASTAWTDKDRYYIPKGATGIGVRLLAGFISEYLK